MSAGVLAVRSRSMSVLVALALALVGLAVLPATAHAAAGDPDTTFNDNVGTLLEGTVHAVAVQADGKVLAGGLLLLEGQTQFLMRFNADGTLDVAFNEAVKPHVTSPVFSIAVQPSDGTILTAGLLKPFILRFDSNGTLDQQFVGEVNSHVNDGVFSLAIQSDGTIVAGGLFSKPANNVARFNIDGTPDTTFNAAVGSTLNNWVRTVAVQTDDRVVAGGLFTSPANHLARFNADGTPDVGFNATVGNQLDDWVVTAAVGPDGKIVTGGFFGSPSAHLAQFNNNGSSDDVFNNAVATTVDSRVESVAVQSDGKVVAGGRFAAPTKALARFNSNGTPDVAFNANAGTVLSDSVYALALQANGRIVVGGDFTSPPANSLARFEGVDPTAPFAPENLVATPMYTAAQLDFTPGGDGGAPITDYEYRSKLQGQDWGPWTSAGVAASPLVVTGLPNGVPVEVELRAVNEAGPGAAAGTVVTPVGAVFSGLESSIRVFDSRVSQGGSGPLSPGVPVTVDVQAPEGAVAVAYNLTLVDTVEVGHVVVGPADANLNGTSTANWFASGQRWANAYVSALDDAGRIQLVAQGGATEAIVDVTGFYLADGQTVPVGQPAAAPATESMGVVLPAATEDSLFVPLAPERAYDSRESGGPISAGQLRTVDLSAVMPEGATGVAYTLTVTQTEGAGHLSVGVPGAGKPATSVINWFASDQNIANSATAALTGDRSLAVFAGGGPTQFVVDVLGYFTALAPPAEVATANGQEGLRFTAIDPSRAYDSRESGDGPITRGQLRTTSAVPASGAVPPGVGAVAFNLTEADTVGWGHLRVAPGMSQLPSVSTINWYTDGMRVANGSVVAVNDDQMTTYAGATAAGSTQYIVDIGGYYN